SESLARLPDDRPQHIGRPVPAYGALAQAAIDLLDEPQRVARAGQEALIGKARGAIENPHGLVVARAPAILIDRVRRLAHRVDHLQAQRSASLLHGLVGIDAPDLVALEPALDALRLHAAPRAAAVEQTRDDPGLGTRHRRRRRIGLEVEDPDAALDQNIARAGQHALMHPTLAALKIADLAPDVELLDDLHRQAFADEHPVDRIALARARAQVHFVDPQGGKTRQRPFGRNGE